MSSVRTATLYQTQVGPEVELEFEPNGEITEKKGEDGCFQIAYLSHDGDYSTDNMGECMGELLSFHRSAPKDHLVRGLKALGRDEHGNLDESLTPDSDAVLLDCFQHGCEIWSIHGEGTQCQWDTARGAGVWVPDKWLLEELAKLSGDERRAKAVEYARQFLAEYNAILEGDVWGVVVQNHNADGSLRDYDSCWGYVGETYARETVKENLR